MYYCFSESYHEFAIRLHPILAIIPFECNCYCHTMTVCSSPAVNVLPRNCYCVTVMLQPQSSVSNPCDLVSDGRVQLWMLFYLCAADNLAPSCQFVCLLVCCEGAFALLKAAIKFFCRPAKYIYLNCE